MGKRAAIAVAAAFLLAAGTAWALQVPLTTLLLARIAADRIGRDITATLPDGLHVILCGTGSPLPDPSRAGPCTLVIAGRQQILVDAGEGSARSLATLGVPAGGIDALFLTHFHSDHFDGLGPLLLQRWVGRAATSPLPVHGPAGVERIVQGFNFAYTADNGYRTAHHGPKIAPPAGAGALARPFAVPSAPRNVLEKDGLTITAFAVDHSPVHPAIGYRFTYKGRSLVISGDTAKSARVATAARGADLLIHEALQPKLVAILTNALADRGRPNTAQIMRDILDYHSSPEDAAEVAAAAGVRALVLTHIVPPIPARIFHKAFLGDAASRFNGPITVGTDGLMLSLPAGSTAIDVRDLS
ncbi:ribonuclease Z [Polymorphobacter multimanifer]|uniref:Ribonuclease Z n=1 Tax=Polymorphobacter multimanifer TaxID=1070431 RepID=A0A841L7P8_9SPHN|nr:MBL fold metallo-hydrolase [Polymorphobacter multimanifer]MBB6228460.1 ribonuclease Z [Polymorphobacter multimanifer]GGI80608.1 ribonuclease Z [Polymorphobacter multimanifer]